MYFYGRWNLYLRLSAYNNFHQTYRLMYSQLFLAFKNIESWFLGQQYTWLSNSSIFITHVARKIFSNVTVNFLTYLIKMTQWWKRWWWHRGGFNMCKGVYINLTYNWYLVTTNVFWLGLLKRDKIRSRF